MVILLSLTVDKMQSIFDKVVFTIRAAKQLQPNANLPTIFCVPCQRNQTNMFSRKGVMEDIPLDLIIVPVPRQSLQLDWNRK